MLSSVLEAEEMVSTQIPEIRWKANDDLCDCTFQRIYWATNPYLGTTMEMRLCCAWKKIAEVIPDVAEFIREIPAYDNQNTEQWEFDPAEWNGEYDMPRALWYRQLAVKQRRPLSAIRHDYEHLEAPKAIIPEPIEQFKVIVPQEVLEYYLNHIPKPNLISRLIGRFYAKRRWLSKQVKDPQGNAEAQA